MTHMLRASLVLGTIALCLSLADSLPLGAPARLECGMIGALAINVTPETPALLAANGIWQAVSEPSVLIPEAA